MSVRLHLVRHCAHGDLGKALSGRAPGLPLTLEGRGHAHRLGATLGGSQLNFVHSSPRERAVETAEAIAAPAGLVVERTPALDEIDFGRWQGQAFDALAADPAWHRWNRRRSRARAPGGETMREAVDRVLGHLDGLVASIRSGAAVCVTHCDIIRGVVAHYLGLSFDRLLRFDIDPGSITTLLFHDGEVRLLNLNKECS